MRIHFLCTLMGHVPGSLLWGKYKMRQYEKKIQKKKHTHICCITSDYHLVK